MKFILIQIFSVLFSLIFDAQSQKVIGYEYLTRQVSKQNQGNKKYKSNYNQNGYKVKQVYLFIWRDIYRIYTSLIKIL